MSWFNWYGFAIVVAILVPNVVFALKCKDGFQNKFSNKTVETAEQIGRFGCFAFMIFYIPGTSFGWLFADGLTAYIVVDVALTALYCAVWAICFKRNGIFRALSLSIIPSVMFLFSGIVTTSILLTLSAIIFAPCHILISCKNAM